MQQERERLVEEHGQAEPITQLQIGGQELRELRTLFRAPEAPQVQRPLKPLFVKLFTRRVFSEAEIWRLVYFRYNSIANFDNPIRTFQEIAAITGIKYQTVGSILQRFIRDGFQVVIRRHYNGNSRKDNALKLPLEIQRHLLSYQS